MTEPVGTPKLVKVGPIEVMAKEPTEGQATVLAKAMAAARRGKDDASALGAIDMVFRVSQALLVDPEDANRIDDGLIDGTIVPSDLSALLGLEADDDKPKPAPAKRTRRSR